MAHTPGTWKFDNNLGCKVIKGNKSGTHRQAQHTEIAATVGLVNEETDKANARLMAAAPDLLEALEALAYAVAPDLDQVERRSVEPFFQEPLAKACKAIARAKGETE